MSQVTALVTGISGIVAGIAAILHSLQTRRQLGRQMTRCPVIRNENAK